MENKYTVDLTALNKETNIIKYGSYREHGKEWINIAQELCELNTNMRKLSILEKCLHDQLKAISENECARGGDFIFTKTINNGSVNYKLVPELNGVDLNPYRRSPVATWSIKKINN